MKFDENEAFRLLLNYYGYPGDTRLQAKILESLYEGVKGLLVKEEKIYRVTLSESERRAEGFYALLGALQRSKQDPEHFLPRFLAILGGELNKYVPHRGTISIEEDTAEDPALGPEDAYILKEQMSLVKDFLQKHYTNDTVEMFFRRYAEGETLESLAQSWGLTNQSIAARLCPILRRVQKHMKRLTEHGI